eukprot:gnl/TRDRNA2_/TRDRNA2_36515_c0_seq1.p1 gnl/TRDRNA2_/TRDRNA2_36515_c0~~gnl/TRDRNA2_/TRDRNA2_36515_c0_seq1.p1  ORF type:complete len:381 (+),score=27.43 gnl/TRDRNA2_/TRDRNA2_36515_c0_seq1:17-1159(+)
MAQLHLTCPSDHLSMGRPQSPLRQAYGTGSLMRGNSFEVERGSTYGAGGLTRGNSFEFDRGSTYGTGGMMRGSSFDRSPVYSSASRSGSFGRRTSVGTPIGTPVSNAMHSGSFAPRSARGPRISGGYPSQRATVAGHITGPPIWQPQHPKMPTAPPVSVPAAPTASAPFVEGRDYDSTLGRIAQSTRLEQARRSSSPMKRLPMPSASIQIYQPAPPPYHGGHRTPPMTCRTVLSELGSTPPLPAPPLNVLPMQRSWTDLALAVNGPMPGQKPPDMKPAKIAQPTAVPPKAHAELENSMRLPRGSAHQALEALRENAPGTPIQLNRQLSGEISGMRRVDSFHGLKKILMEKANYLGDDPYGPGGAMDRPEQFQKKNSSFWS